MPDDGNNSNGGAGTGGGGDQSQRSQQSQQSQQQNNTPPWERNGEQFDPERAWNLVQSLRNENGTLKSDRDTLQGKVSEFEQKGMTEVERATQRATAAEEKLGQNTNELTRLRVALEHGFVSQRDDGKFVLDQDAVDLLGSGSAEELAERAKRIATLRGQQADAQAQQPFQHGAGGGSPKAGDMNSLILGQLAKRG